MHWSQGPSWNHHHTLSPGAVLERVIWNINDILNLSCNYKYNNEYRTKKTRGNALYQCKPCINTETNGNTIDKCKKYKRRREVRWAKLPRNHHYTRGLLTICWQCWWWLWECFFLINNFDSCSSAWGWERRHHHHLPLMLLQEWQPTPAHVGDPVTYSIALIITTIIGIIVIVIVSIITPIIIVFHSKINITNFINSKLTRNHH